MEVTHIHWSGRPIIGGIERHLDSLIPELNHLWCKSSLICGNKGLSSYQVYFEGFGAKNEFDINYFYHENRDMIDRSNIIHIHNGHVISPKKTEVMFNFFKKRDKRVVLSIHNIDICEESRDIVDLPFDSYIVYSSFMRDNVGGIFGIVPEVLPLYIKIDYGVEETRAKKDFIKILQPTRYSRWKGSNLSLECIVDLLNEGKNMEFVHGGCYNLLYGQLKIPANVRKWVENNTIKLEDYSFDEIGREIKNADIILHPTIGVEEYGEPFSLTCLESMLLGKPIIASDSGFVPKLLEGYSRKQIVKAGSKRELLNAIRKWILKPIPPLSANDVRLIDGWKNYINSSSSRHIMFYQQLVDTP